MNMMPGGYDYGGYPGGHMGGPRNTDLQDMFRLRMAQQLAQQAQNGPVYSPGQGIVKLLAGALAGQQMGSTLEGIDARKQAAADELAGAFRPIPSEGVAGPRAGTGTAPTTMDIARQLMGSQDTGNRAYGQGLMQKALENQMDVDKELNVYKGKGAYDLTQKPQLEGAIEAAKNTPLIARALGTANAQNESDLNFKPRIAGATAAATLPYDFAKQGNAANLDVWKQFNTPQPRNQYGTIVPGQMPNAVIPQLPVMGGPRMPGADMPAPAGGPPSMDAPPPNAPPMPNAAPGQQGAVTPGILDPGTGNQQQGFQNAKALREEFEGLAQIKNAREASTAYQAIVDAAKRPSKASDLNMVYGLAKLFDPGSVVREGEMVMVKNTSSLPDWLKGAIDGLNGGAVLQPATRAAILAEAGGRMQTHQGAFDQLGDRYKFLAGRSGLKEDEIVGGLPYRFDPKAVPAVPELPPGAKPLPDGFILGMKGND